MEQVIFEEVVSNWRFVHLPACKYRDRDCPASQLSTFHGYYSLLQPSFPQYGAVEQGVDLQALLFALLSEAVADIRRIREAHGYDVRPEIQRNKFALWERGQMLSSAGFLLDFSRAVNLPRGAVRLSRDVLEVEAPHMDELLAASVAGIPWRHEFPNACMRCGKPGSWRSCAAGSKHAPLEVTWRYQRPENAVPLCHHCAETLNFLRDESLRIDLVWGLWGPRFEALWNWHKALDEDRLPAWDTYAILCGRENLGEPPGKPAVARLAAPSRARRMGSAAPNSMKPPCGAPCTANPSADDSRVRPPCSVC